MLLIQDLLHFAHTTGLQLFMEVPDQSSTNRPRPALALVPPKSSVSCGTPFNSD